jgi:hypothetical protein
MKDFMSRDERLKGARKKRLNANVSESKNVDQANPEQNKPSSRRVWSFQEFISHVAICGIGGWFAFKVYPHSQQFGLLIAVAVAIYGFGVAFRS